MPLRSRRYESSKNIDYFSAFEIDHDVCRSARTAASSDHQWPTTGIIIILLETIVALQLVARSCRCTESAAQPMHQFWPGDRPIVVLQPKPTISAIRIASMRMEGKAILGKTNL